MYRNGLSDKFPSLTTLPPQHSINNSRKKPPFTNLIKCDPAMLRGSYDEN